MTEPMKILIAYDGTESARRAVGYASKVLGAGDGTHAVVVTAWESSLHQAARLAAMSSIAGSGATEAALSITDDAEFAEASRVNAEGVDLARGAGFAARGTLVEVSTTVWTAIIKASDTDDVDVIVTGSRGQTGLRALWHSSVSEHVLRGCRRPVMIVPSGAPAL